MAQLDVLAKYTGKLFGRPVNYAVGQVIDVNDLEATWLKADSPGSFRDHQQPVVKAATEPPLNKAVQSPPKAKAPVTLPEPVKMSVPNPSDFNLNELEAGLSGLSTLTEWQKALELELKGRGRAGAVSYIKGKINELTDGDN